MIVRTEVLSIKYENVNAFYLDGYWMSQHEHPIAMMDNVIA